jgi:uncharacterized protein DUF4397
VRVRGELWMGAVLVPLGCAAVVAGGCSSHGGGGAPSSDAGGDAGASTLEGGDDSGDEAEATAPQTQLRMAHVSPDAPPLDLCVAPHGSTSFRGPLVAQLAMGSTGDAGDADIETDAAVPGVAYAQVSAYVGLAPGPYDVRIVAAGASSCDSAIAAGGDAAGPVADWTNLPPLAVDTSATLLLAGDLQPAGDDARLTLTLLTDDSVLSTGAAVVRAINAVPSERALDFGLGSGSAWEPLLTNVTFGAASAATGPGEGTVDANGYTPIPPLSSQAVSARPSSSDAGADVAVAMHVEIAQGSIATILAIGGKTGDSAHLPALLVCTDNQPSGGVLSDCSVAH